MQIWQIKADIICENQSHLHHLRSINYRLKVSKSFILHFRQSLF